MTGRELPPGTSRWEVKTAIYRELKLDGCTQADLAGYLGWSQSMVSVLLRGARGSPQQLADMAAAVGLAIHPDWADP